MSIWENKKHSNTPQRQLGCAIHSCARGHNYSIEEGAGLMTVFNNETMKLKNRNAEFAYHHIIVISSP